MSETKGPSPAKPANSKLQTAQCSVASKNSSTRPNIPISSGLVDRLPQRRPPGHTCVNNDANASSCLHAPGILLPKHHESRGGSLVAVAFGGCRIVFLGVSRWTGEDARRSTYICSICEKLTDSPEPILRHTASQRFGDNRAASSGEGMSPCRSRGILTACLKGGDIPGAFPLLNLDRG